MEKYLVLVGNQFNVINGEDYTEINDEGIEEKSTYKMLKENVGGMIECVSFIKNFAERGIDLWINEEGKFFDLPVNLAIEHQGNIVEVLNGNIVFSRADDNGRTLPLTEEDIDFIKSVLLERVGIINFRNQFTGTYSESLCPIVSL